MTQEKLEFFLDTEFLYAESQSEIYSAILGRRKREKYKIYIKDITKLSKIYSRGRNTESPGAISRAINVHTVDCNRFASRRENELKTLYFMRKY